MLVKAALSLRCLALGGLILCSACAHGQRAKSDEQGARPAASDAGTEAPEAATSGENRGAKTATRERLPLSCKEHVAQVRSSVRELSQKQWSGARSHAVSALNRLADAIEDSAPGNQQVLQSVSEVRYQSELFEASAALERIEPLKAGLKATAAAMEVLQRELGIEGLDNWIASSRRSVEGLSLDSPFQLQRAPIQDAFRTLGDTFVLAMQLANKC